MAAQKLDTALWAFSLVVYGGDGVADECLALQERLNLDINLLLLAAFAGAREGLQLAVRDIAAANAAAANWHDGIVRPLRHARRTLKPAAESDGDLRESSAALRTQIKGAELAAEKLEQAMLWQWLRQHLPASPRGDEALAGNLRAVLEFYGATERPETALPRLLTAASAYRP